jgi:hypothetical protein
MSDADDESSRDDVDVEHRKLERLVPEIIKRVLEAGFEKLSEGPENMRRVMGELRLPKEAIATVMSQLDDTKSGLYRVVAKEVRDFLEQTNFADELTRALTTLSFEIRTEVRFIPNDAKGPPVPEVKSNVSVKRRTSTPPPAPSSTKDPNDPTPDSTRRSPTE